MRIGSGFDVHAFGPGDSIVLGGVRIPHTRGVIAHSDGDVVLHALCDAMLGAAGLGDIGMHFPDTDPVWKGAESRRFVAAVLEMLGVRKLKVGNADITLLAQSPKVSPYRLEIRRSIAQMLGVTENQVNIKATTTEHLGFIGRNEGIAAQAVVLLEPAPEKPDDSRSTGATRRWRRPWPGAWSARDWHPARLTGRLRGRRNPRIRSQRRRSACAAARFASAARTPNGWRASWRAPRAASPSRWASPGSRIAMPSPRRHFTVPRGKRAAEEFVGLAGEGYEVTRGRRASAQTAARRARGQSLRRSRCAMCTATRRSCAQRIAEPGQRRRAQLLRPAAIRPRWRQSARGAAARRNDRRRGARGARPRRIGDSCCRRRAA